MPSPSAKRCHEAVVKFRHAVYHRLALQPAVAGFLAAGACATCVGSPPAGLMAEVDGCAEEMAGVLVETGSMADVYESYTLLRSAEREGTDFRIHSRRRGSGVAVMAIHGGDIEPGTSEVASAIAADFHSLYLFEGVKNRGNRKLHLASTRFDEPRGLSLARKSETVVTVHGCVEKDAVIIVGGLAAPLVRRIQDALTRAGFPVDTRDGLQGVHPGNLCNLGRSGEGVQLELSSGMRRAMFLDLTRSGRGWTTEVFHRLVAVLADALPGMEAAHRPERPRQTEC